MKKKESPTKLIIETILESWNKNCEINNLDEQFKLEYISLEENIKINDRDGKIKIGRVTIHLMKVEKEEDKVIDIKQTLLFKRDFPIPSKVSYQKESYWQEVLSRELLYEMLGTFCMTTRGMALERIKIQGQKDLMEEINSKINKEENEILNKPKEQKTEEDKVFELMHNAKKVKIQKTGMIDKFGSDIVSETIN